MNSDVFAGKWKQMRGQAKEWWGKLTDDDLEQIDGKRDKLVGILQERTATLGRRRKRSSSASPRCDVTQARWHGTPPACWDRASAERGDHVALG